MAGQKNTTAAHLGFEDKLWAAADKLRGNMDAAEYKHVVLGLIFLKYISDAFMEKFKALKSDKHADPEDKDEYLADNIFWVPPEARWDYLQKNGGQFYTPACVVRVLVEMIEPYKGRVFDPCCGSGGMFVSAVKFVQAHASGNGNGKSKVRAQREISIYGQESNYTTWRLALMNLAIRSIDGDIRWGDSFLDDKHKDLKADFLLANPPFNMEDWGYSKVKNDARWRRFDQPGGLPAEASAQAGNAQFSLPAGGERKRKDGTTYHVDGGNANYAWILHFMHHLAPHGTAGFVLANGSLTSNTSGEGDIRKAIIEADMVDCIIALPGQLFYTTPIPACLWFLTRNKGADKQRGYRARQGETLFIDARKLGTLIDRTHRDLSEEEIVEIGRTYHAWRGEKDAGKYEDRPGFCKAATLKEIQAHGHVLTPGRYVGVEEIEDDGVPFEEKMAELSAELYEQMGEAQELDEIIKANLCRIGFDEG